MTKTTMKGNPGKNDTGAEGHAQDHVTGTGDQDHVTNARDHVTVNAATEDRNPAGKVFYEAIFFYCSKLYFCITRL